MLRRQFLDILQFHRQQCMQYFLQRQFCITSGLHNKSADRLVRKFLMNNNATKKSKKWHESKVLWNPADLAAPQMKGERNSHRRHVLNKVFMNGICDILSTGNLSSLFMGHGLEISKVDVSTGMDAINVHWFCSESDLEGKVEKLLKENSYAIRNELIQQRVMGRVPQINFVRDKSYYKHLEVEKLLAIADYGEGFEPSDSTLQVATDVMVVNTKFDNFIMNLKITDSREPDDIFARALSLANTESSEMEDSSVELPLDLPAFQETIFHVNDKKLLMTVKQAMVKSEAEHRKNPDKLPSSSSTEYNEKPGSHHVSTRTEHIKQWASSYKEMQRREKRKKKEEAAQLSVLPVYYEEDDIDELEYEEEEDFFDENFEFDSVLKEDENF